MAEPTREELDFASRVIQDMIDRHGSSMDVIRQAQQMQEQMVSQELRPYDVLQIFTSGTLAQYEDNLRRLLHGYDLKLQERKHTSGATWSHVYSRLSDGVMDSAARLRGRVGHMALPAPNDNYINELARFWRKYGGAGGPGPGHSMSWHYEDCWTFVAGRVLMLE